MHTTNKLIDRPLYLNRLKKWLNHTDLVKIVTGVRRCGKSKIFTLFQNELKKQYHIRENQIININLEDMFQTNEIGLSYNKNNLLEPNQALLNFIIKKLKNNKMNYVFIDEVQLLENWQQVANTLRLCKNVDLYLTGSNAYMFSSDLSNSFGGRYIEIKMMPYSFKEFCSAYMTINAIPLKNTKTHLQKPDLMFLYEKYIKESGFPQTVSFLGDRSQILDYLINTVYYNTIQKDIVSRFNLSHDNKLDAVIRYLFDNIGNETSLRGIERGLKSAGQNISIPTIDNYIKGLIDSYLIYKCDRYDIKGKQFLDANSKYYVCDIGLRSILLGKTDIDLGHILENIVYLELRRRGYRVSVGKVHTKVVKEADVSKRKTIEVDFVAQKDGLIEYYQVSLYTLDPQTLARELAPLEAIKDNYPKFLLSLDYGSSNNNGINRMNVLDWLTT